MILFSLVKMMADTVVPVQVLSHFCEKPELCTVSPLGCGNINDTFLVKSSLSSFVLQRISDHVFPEPLRIIDNFSLVSRHLLLKNRLCREQFSVAAPVVTLRGELHHKDKHGGYWRGQSYIPHKVISRISESRQAYQVGRTLALFHRRVSDVAVSALQEPLPGFHDLHHYLEEFEQEKGKREISEDENIRYCQATLARFRHRSALFSEAKNNGTVALQLVHGDPKIDNFLFDEKGAAFGMLDLDTVGTGLVHHDIGDCLRSCCNVSGEEGRGRSGNIFDMTLCQSLLEGYFSICHSFFSEQQRLLIFDAVLLITFELGLRFFTDHLRGNSYFKVSRDGENLLRAINQFQLADDIKRCEKQIKTLLT